MIRVLQILVFMMLIVPAVSDIRSRDFSILPPLLLFLAGLILKYVLLFFAGEPGFLSGEMTYIRGCLSESEMVTGLRQECLQIAIGMLPGAAFFLIQRVSPKSVGGGDVLLIFLLGILCGFVQTLFVCLAALCLICLYGAAVSIRTRKWGNLTLPFLPFLAAGYLASLFYL